MHFKESFEYLMSLSNRELRKEIENSNWNFILQELRYAGDEIERLNNIINELEKEIYNVVDKMYNSLIEIEGRGYYYQDLLPLECLIYKLKELKGDKE